MTLTLAVPEAAESTFTGLSGQHLVLRAVIDGEEVRRTYSLISPAGQFPLQIAVRRHDSGVMSRYLVDEVEPAANLDAMAPGGSFHSRLPHASGRAYLAVAAGSGITPVLAIMRAKLGQESDCCFTLVYGNQNTARAMCLDEVLALKDQYLERFDVRLVMSREPQDIELFNGRIDGGKMRSLALGYIDLQEIDESFICGPGSMNESVSEALLDLGFDAAGIHLERFNVASEGAGVASAEPVSKDESSADQGETTQVQIVMNGRRREFLMPDDGRTLLEVALDNGIEVPYSCCAGVCSTCRCKVTEGAVEMAQNYALEEWETEEGFVLACQATPTTELVVLDYDSV